MSNPVSAQNNNFGFFKSSLTVSIMALTSAFTFNATANAVEFTKPKAVVELFTSQGCSSCPPADQALREINTDGEILGLALHVDYWDRLGWKDTFASPENTARQRLYAQALGERSVYTPQAIINGRTHLVGSRKAQILSKAADFAETDKGLIVDIDLAKNGEAINVTIASSEEAKNATLYVFYFNPQGEVKIKRGENAGRNISYSNIVGKVEMIGMVGEAGLTTEFAIADMKQKGFKACALILQDRTTNGFPGAIIGASVISDL
jgi:hypothetical protein